MDAGPITAQVPPDGPGSAAAGPSQPAPSGRATAATVTAYAAASAAFAYTLVSVSWALGAHGLISTVDGYAARPAHQKGATPVLLARAAAVAKAAGGPLALGAGPAPGGGSSVGWPRTASAAASVLLIALGRLNVLAAAPCPVRFSPPPRNGDRTALRWHADVWDLWFFVWGILLALARRQPTAGSVHRAPR